MSEMTVEQIKDTRNKYGLSQRSFAALLGIGAASIVRYEQGAKPSKAIANLIRAAQDPRFMQGCLERDGQAIPAEQRKRAETYVYEYIRLESPETEKPMDEMSRIYEFTLQQEVLNEQAANIVCEILRYMSANGITADEDDNPLVILADKLFEVKQAIISKSSRDEQVLEQLRGYLKYTEEYVDSLVSVKKAA
jgi:HTH-type transcriptional regulator/antitoxin PezA